jgi:outer membrane biosynthesis protein TonB
MTRKNSKDWPSPYGRWQWNGQQWSPRSPFKPSLMARVMALQPNRRNSLLSAAIAALMLLTLTVAVACGSPAASTPVVAAATTATPTAEPTSTPAPTADPTPTPTPAPTLAATPAPPPAVAPAAAPVAAVPAPAPRVAPPPPPVAQPPAADPYAPATAAGASAVCADGTWSYSKSRSGTCSHHGGVHWWTGNLGPAGPGGH